MASWNESLLQLTEMVSLRTAEIRRTTLLPLLSGDYNMQHSLTLQGIPRPRARAALRRSKGDAMAAAVGLEEVTT